MYPKQIFAIRTLLGLDREAFARKVGLVCDHPERIVSGWETGARVPSTRNEIKIEQLWAEAIHDKT